MFMGRREHAAIGTTLLVVLGLGPSSACVKDAPIAAQTDPSTSKEAETTTGPLLPLKQGTSWTYKVTKEGKSSTKVLEVGAEEEVGGDGASSGERAFKITSSKDGKADGVTWEAAEGKRFVRYREQELSGKSGDVKTESSWDPARLIVDGASAHTEKGASWSDEYAETVTEDDKTETSDEKDVWSVEATDEVVTVPAGTFKALVLRRQGGSKAKTFWYVKGVGKVKEDGDELEELTEYKVGDDSDDSDASDEESTDTPSDSTENESGDGDDTAEPSSDNDGDAEPMPGSDDATTKTPDAGTGKATGTEAAP